MEELQTIKNNMEKKDTYNDLMDKYSRAYEQEFYYECLFILYRVIEDRLRAILYHSGIIKERTSKNLDNKESKEYLSSINAKYNNKPNPNFFQIQDKLDMLSAIIKWEQEDNRYMSSEYLDHLHIQYEEIDKKEVLSLIDDITEWKLYRNDLIHKVFEDNIESVNSVLKELIDNGDKIRKRLYSLAYKVGKHSYVKKDI